MMKQPINFRLSLQAIQTFSLLERELHATKTAVVEVALQAYAQRKLSARNPLLAYAGSLDDADAKSMLHHIKTSRHNKEKNLFL